MSNFNSDDPRITAFVLGELDERETKEFQQLLEDDRDLREAVEETRRLTDQLTLGFKSEAFAVEGIDKVQLLGAANDRAPSDAELPGDAAVRVTPTPLEPNRHGTWRLVGAVAAMAAVVAILVTINNFGPTQGNAISSLPSESKATSLSTGQSQDCNELW